MKILIPGGCGYIGARLIPFLLGDGHEVTAYDSMLFGDGHLPGDNDMMATIKADVRDREAFRRACVGKDAIIFLASISSNDMCQRHEAIADEINVAAIRPCMEDAEHAGIAKFIYASSVAGYTRENASEGDELAPLTAYARGKRQAEEIVCSFGGDMDRCITRSASVCGYSPRMRLDVTVNKMVSDAYRNHSIQVNGGQQTRCHVHIDDLCAFYRELVKEDSVPGVDTVNVVAETQRVLDTARLVQEVLADMWRKVEVVVSPRSDDRSYGASSMKAAQIYGFKPKRSLHDAILDMACRFDAGYWRETNDSHLNITPSLV